MARDTCSMCSVLLESKGAKIKKIAEFLQILFVNTNCKLLEKLLICDTCLTKVQSACEFKASCLENLQTYIKQENIENQTLCEVCKKMLNSSDCIPLFYSVTDIDKLNVFKFLSSELELKSQSCPKTCESCHKLLINFCIVMKSFSVFLQDQIITDSVTNLQFESSNSARNIDVNSVDCIEDCKMDIKQEDLEINENPVLTTSYEDVLCKKEEIDLKTEGSIWDNNRQEVETFTCLSCDYQTEQKRNLDRHMFKHKSSDETKMFKCQICCYQTKYKCNLKSHLIIHKKSNEIEMFKCLICDYQTKRKDSLQKHLIVHKTSNEVEIYKCQICNFQTKRKTSIKKHIIIHKNSNEIDMYKCSICDFQTKHKSYLKQHIIIHKKPNETEMFKCHICDFQTKQKRYLRNHLIIHKNSSEIQTFKCQICDYQAKHRWHLKRHVISVHKNSNEIEVFKCIICDYQTKYKNSLKKHILIHKEYSGMLKCELCDFQTKYTYNLKRHLINHKECS